MRPELCRELKLIETNRQLRNQLLVLNREIDKLKKEIEELKNGKL